MWQPTIQQFNELFNNEYVLNIMVVLNKKTDKSITPTELSDVLKIHISTAKKYLELLTKFNFATKEVLIDKLGRPSLYTLKTNKIDISLSLDKDSFVDELDIEIWNPLIREVKGIEKLAKYEFDSNDLIKEIQVKTKTKAKRFVTQKFELSRNEQQFMKYLPFSTQDPKSLEKICFNANIHSKFEMKAIETFVRKLLKYDIIEIIYL